MPATMRSTESSISLSVMAVLFLRPVRIAASLSRLARSAPENPGVRCATSLRSTSSPSFLLRACTLRISRRPLASGTSTETCLSKRPGLRRAGSRMSERLVAATTMMPVLPSKPSISVRSWLSVCSRSSLPPPTPVPRERPTASISSCWVRERKSEEEGGRQGKREGELKKKEAKKRVFDPDLETPPSGPLARARRPPRGRKRKKKPKLKRLTTNTMHGAFSLAFLNRSRTLEAPTPTNISTNSEPEIEKKGTPASPAIALASSVLPVPGGPTSSTPLGILAPTAVNRSGLLRNSTTSIKSCLASSTPATSSNPIPVLGSIWNLALDLPKAIGFPGPPPPMPPGPPPRRDSRKSPPTSSSGNARLPSRPATTAPPSSACECAAKSTPLARNLESSSCDVPGSCTRTRWTRLPSSGLAASTIAMVPFS